MCIVVVGARAGAVYEPQFSGAFTTIGDERYFEPDDGDPIPILLDARGDAALGAEMAHAAARAAIAAWSNLPDTTLRFVDAGFTNDLKRTCPGPNKIVFDDPDGILPPPVADPEVPGQCRGILALGITRTSTFEFKAYAGSEFARTRCGFVVVADGWGDCSNWDACNLAEAITHELGHLIGLAHSSERGDEPDPLLRDAAMYFRAHFDGRCASVRSDDQAGARFLYPSRLPVTIATSTPLMPAFLGLPFTQPLVANGGDGSYVWSLARGNATGLAILPNGALYGTPERLGSQFVVARAVDSGGGRHEKVLDLVVFTPLTAPPTSTATSSATSTPTPTPSPTTMPSAVPTPTPSVAATNSPTPLPTSTVTPGITSPPSASATPTTTASMCSGDCDRSGSVSVDEIVTAIQIALGNADLDSCAAADRDGDGSVGVDELIGMIDAALRGCEAANAADRRIMMEREGEAL